jgi:DNA polymerase I-like protein with 3'-5' exonuclease and polymerase domains
MGKQTVLGCGYGLGGGGFAYMLDTTYDVQIERDEADTIVKAYRRNAPEVVRFWKRLDKALVYASQNVGTEFSVIKGKISIKFTREDRFWIKLPSGRLLRYYQVRGERTPKGWNWSCFGRLKAGAGYGRVKIYGGALTGHIVQSSARDIMASAMVSLDALDHPLVLTVHDELVELDDDRFDEFEAVMSSRPEWLTPDFPLAVEAFQSERYRK